jgi:uroporphyrinogen decarboxylase
MVGTETLLIALLEEPDWVRDIFNTQLDLCIAQFEIMLGAGYRFDSIFWPDDMGYKNTPFFSTKIYRESLKPIHTRAVAWAHDRGMVAQLHSCGDIMPLIPDVAETGIDVLNPLEVKAGMDVVALKKEYGDRLAFRGGINAQLYDDKEKVLAEIEYYVPILMENGGYIFASDHSIPNCTTLDTMTAIIDTVKRIGQYK